MVHALFFVPADLALQLLTDNQLAFLTMILRAIFVVFVRFVVACIAVSDPSRHLAEECGEQIQPYVDARGDLKDCGRRRYSGKGGTTLSGGDHKEVRIGVR